MKVGDRIKRIREVTSVKLRHDGVYVGGIYTITKVFDHISIEIRTPVRRALVAKENFIIVPLELSEYSRTI